MLHRGASCALVVQRSRQACPLPLDGYRKHPPLVDSRLIPEILSFSGEGGLRQFWKEQESLIRTVAVDDSGVWVDLDTREDYHKCKEKYEKN